MIYNKGIHHGHQVRELEPSTGTKRTVPCDNVLTDLFIARMGEDGPLSSPMHDKPQRAAPLVSSLASPSLFQVGSDPKAALGHEMPSANIFRQLGQTKRFKHNHSSVSDSNTSSFAFPLHSELFLPSPHFHESWTTANNTRPSQGHDERLISQSLRSLTCALLITGQTTTSTLPTMMNSKKRPLTLATRIRLVGQVLGQERVQEVLAVVKEMKQSPALAYDEFVGVWENTPVDALKALPWEDLLRDAEERLQSHQNASHKNA